MHDTSELSIYQYSRSQINLERKKCHDNNLLAIQKPRTKAKIRMNLSRRVCVTRTHNDVADDLECPHRYPQHQHERPSNSRYKLAFKLIYVGINVDAWTSLPVPTESELVEENGICNCYQYWHYCVTKKIMTDVMCCHWLDIFYDKCIFWQNLKCFQFWFV